MMAQLSTALTQCQQQHTEHTTLKKLCGTCRSVVRRSAWRLLAERWTAGSCSAVAVVATVAVAAGRGPSCVHCNLSGAAKSFRGQLCAAATGSLTDPSLFVLCLPSRGHCSVLLFGRSTFAGVNLKTAHFIWLCRPGSEPSAGRTAKAGTVCHAPLAPALESRLPCTDPSAACTAPLLEREGVAWGATSSQSSAVRATKTDARVSQSLPTWQSSRAPLLILTLPPQSCVQRKK